MAPESSPTRDRSREPARRRTSSSCPARWHGSTRTGAHSGRYPLQNGSSAPFHIAIAAPPASLSSVVTTCARSVSLAKPGFACATVLRLTQVWRLFAAAARFCCFASSMSAAVQATVGGPVLRYVAPPEATSANASRPSGVVVPGSGPFARMIGNVFAPSRRTVPFPSLLVVAAAAPLAYAAATTASTPAKRRTTIWTPSSMPARPQDAPRVAPTRRFVL